MSDALTCDGPGCHNVGEFPFLGWWRITNISTVLMVQPRTQVDFCSWECLGAFALQNAGGVEELQRRIDELTE